MEGSPRRGAALSVAAIVCTALGGCIHSDSQRRGVVDGRSWCERVAEEPSQPYVDELRSELMALGPDVNEDEATLLAEVSVRHADYIRRKWRIVRPIEIHNLMVNVGLRQRGLCYQCAEAMYERLRDLKLKTFDLHWGVAHKDDLWLEHSGVIVTAKGRPFSEGLVVDAWRHSGRLRWALVSGDRYPWVQMAKWKYPETARFLENTAVAGRPAGEVTERTEQPAPAGERMKAVKDPAGDAQRKRSGESDRRAAIPAATGRTPPC